MVANPTPHGATHRIRALTRIRSPRNCATSTLRRRAAPVLLVVTSSAVPVSTWVARAILRGQFIWPITPVASQKTGDQSAVHMRGHSYWLVDPIEETLAVYRWYSDGDVEVLIAERDEVVRAEPFDAMTATSRAI
jgi:hypothetical protein